MELEWADVNSLVILQKKRGLMLGGAQCRAGRGRG